LWVAPLAFPVLYEIRAIGLAVWLLVEGNRAVAAFVVVVHVQFHTDRLAVELEVVAHVQYRMDRPVAEPVMAVHVQIRMNQVVIVLAAAYCMKHWERGREDFSHG